MKPVRTLTLTGDPIMLQLKLESASCGSAVALSTFSHLKEPSFILILSKQLKETSSSPILPSKHVTVSHNPFFSSLDSKSNPPISFMCVSDPVSYQRSFDQTRLILINNLASQLSYDTNIPLKDVLDFLKEHPDIKNASTSHVSSLVEHSFQDPTLVHFYQATENEDSSQGGHNRPIETRDLLQLMDQHLAYPLPSEIRPLNVCSVSDAVLVDFSREKPISGVDSKVSLAVSDKDFTNEASKLNLKLHDHLAVNVTMYSSYKAVEKQPVKYGQVTEHLHKKGLKSDVSILEVDGSKSSFSYSESKDAFLSHMSFKFASQLSGGSIDLSSVINETLKVDPLSHVSVEASMAVSNPSKDVLKGFFKDFIKSKSLPGSSKTQHELDYLQTKALVNKSKPQSSLFPDSSSDHIE